MEILGSIKSYDWGTTGKKSKVAQLALKHDQNFSKEFNEITPYAELWYVWTRIHTFQSIIYNIFLNTSLSIGWAIM